MIKKKLFGNSKFIVRVFSLFMAGMISFSPIAAFAEDDDIDTKLTSRVEHTDKDFSEFELEYLSEEDFDKIYENLSDYVDDTDRADDVLQCIIDMETFVNHMSADYSLSNLYTMLDVNDSKAEEDYKKIKETYTNIADKLWIEYSLIAHSNNAEVLKERVDDDDDWQEILDYVPLTEEEKEINKQITELELQYEEESAKEFTTMIDGKEYSESDINDALGDNSISYDEGMKGLADILKNKNKTLGEIYIEMVKLRNTIAKGRGYDNYADYAYKEEYGRDYTPDDLNDFRDGVKEYMSPLLNDIYNEYSKKSDSISEMFEQEITSEECLDNLEEHLDEVSPEMHESFDYMVDHHLINIDIDDKKASGGFTTTMTGNYNCQFLYNDSKGTYSDQITVVHEFGHYNQGYFASEDEYFYNSTDLDVAEIHSQGLEFIYSKYYPEFFGDYADEITFYNTLNTVYGTVEGCKEDAFQIAVYKEDPDTLNLKRLNELYYEICDEYDDKTLFNSYYLGLYGYIPENTILEWVDVPHTFTSPLYYVSYAISGVAVDELALSINENREEGIEKYLTIVNMGSDYSYSEVLEKVGLNNPIENPRFIDYANTFYDIIGIESPYTDQSGVDNKTGEEGNDPNEDIAGEDEVNDKEDDDTKDSYGKNKTSKDNDDAKSDAETISEVFPVFLKVFLIVLIAVIFLLAVIIVIVFTCVNKSKKKKMASNQMPNSQFGIMNQNNGMNYTNGNPMGFTPKNIDGSPMGYNPQNMNNNQMENNPQSMNNNQGLPNPVDAYKNSDNAESALNNMLGADPADYDGPVYNGNISPYSNSDND